MPSGRRNSGLLLYSFLKKEVTLANKDLPKPLTRKQQDKLLKKTIFPAYQGLSVSKIKKGDLRQFITKKVRADRNKRSSPQKIYGRLVHEVSLINERIPESQKFTLSQIRKFVSANLYPKFRGKSYNGIKWKIVAKEIAAEIKKAKKDVCDVLAIPQDIYQQINYFEIDDFLGFILPPCIFVEVVAGEFGRTDIFNTKDYNYFGSGVQQITNALNKAKSKKEIPGDTDNLPKYFGEIQTRPGKKNDGNPENYYLQMILVVNDIPVEEPELVKIPKKQKTKKRKEIAKSTKQYINDRTKRLVAEKSKVKPFRRKLAERINTAQVQRKALKLLIRQKFLQPSILKQFEEAFYKEEKKKIDAAKKKKVIKKYQYDELLSQIRKAFK